MDEALMPEVTTVERRIVVEWTSGLRHILGYTNTQPPAMIETVDKGQFSLYKVTPRAYFYKELTKP